MRKRCWYGSDWYRDEATSAQSNIFLRAITPGPLTVTRGVNNRLDTRMRRLKLLFAGAHNGLVDSKSHMRLEAKDAVKNHCMELRQVLSSILDPTAMKTSWEQE